MIINKCKNCLKEFVKPHNPNREYNFCSYDCRGEWRVVKVSFECNECGQTTISPMNKVRSFCSKDCFNTYKDEGKSTTAQKIRSSKEYELWRKSVFERDEYTCQICGEIGGKLNADHIKRFAHYPELRLVTDNGRTLCESCHLKTPNFGNKLTATGEEG